MSHRRTIAEMTPVIGILDNERQEPSLRHLALRMATSTSTTRSMNSTPQRSTLESVGALLSAFTVPELAHNSIHPSCRQSSTFILPPINVPLGLRDREFPRPKPYFGSTIRLGAQDSTLHPMNRKALG
jgi:hypothetical protein